MTTARLRRRRELLPVLLVAGAITACSNDPGVNTRAAVLPGTIASSAPVPTSTDEPVFTLPPLTLPDRDTAPSTSDVVDASSEAAPTEIDHATAGDTLFAELGNDTIDVTAYVVRIGYDPTDAAPTIAGRVSMSVSGLASIDQMVFDAVALDVHAVTVDGSPVGFETDDDELIIEHPLETGAQATVEVTYDATPMAGTSSFGPPAGWLATSGGSYVLNQPDGLRTWMPADDHPADKATWRFELTVPDGLAAVANGDQLASIDAGPATTFLWEQRDPMATYLVQVLVGDYEVVDGGEFGDVPIVHVAFTEDVARMQPYFDVTVPQLEYFESVFGPYPLDRYGLAFTDSTSGLAMETQGRSMYSRDDFPSTPSGEVGYFEDLLLSHELAHQWFGNAVTPADWGDIWLSESFATYGQWLWFDHSGRQPISESALAGLMARQSGTGSTAVPTVGSLFGVERYEGGAAVLHALRLELGDDDFFMVLQRWAAEYDGTSRTTAEFIALSEDVVDRSLTAFYDTWLFAETLPAEYPS